jgi:hypothetical protein
MCCTCTVLLWLQHCCHKNNSILLTSDKPQHCFWRDKTCKSQCFFGMWKVLSRKFKHYESTVRNIHSPVYKLWALHHKLFKINYCSELNVLKMFSIESFTLQWSFALAYTNVITIWRHKNGLSKSWSFNIQINIFYHFISAKSCINGIVRIMKITFL